MGAPRFQFGTPDAPTPEAEEEETGFQFDPGRRAILPPGFDTTYEEPIVLDADGQPVLDDAGNVIPTSSGEFVTLGFRQITNNPAVQQLTGELGLEYTYGGPVRPRYFENDQAYIWFDDRARVPNAMSPESVALYQDKMVRAGLLDEDNFTRGVWDAASVDANRGLLRIANVNGASAAAMLAYLAEMGGPVKDDGGKVAPTIRLTNRDDLKATFKQVAQTKTGGVFVEDDQIERMVDAYHKSERVYQKALARGGEVGAAPSAQTFAEMSLEEQDPGGATANRFQKMTSVLSQLMGA